MHVRVSGPCETITSRMVDIARKDGIWMFGRAYDRRARNLQRFEFNVATRRWNSRPKKSVSSSSESWGTFVNVVNFHHTLRKNF